MLVKYFKKIEEDVFTEFDYAVVEYSRIKFYKDQQLIGEYDIRDVEITQKLDVVR